MDAGKLLLLRDFIGKNGVLFEIPVYQRNYDWAERNCNRLLDDIKTIIDSGEKHFLGTFVYMPSGNNIYTLQEYIVIDGQQRLTTMMLLLKALADLAASQDPACAGKINDIFLHNQYCPEEFKIKLKPIKSDNEQFLLLLRNKPKEMNEASHIRLNYEICHERMKRWMASGIQPAQILAAMEKLEIVYISLTKGEDDPQIIFESINSTGLELTNADLIRNFLLMDAEDQVRLFEEYWLPIEHALKDGTDYSNLNLFFAQYIVYKTNTPLNAAHIYEQFVRLYKENHYTKESILSELKYYAEIFKEFVYGGNRYSPAVEKALHGLRVLKQTTSYRFLLHVFHDYHQGIINEATLEKVVCFILAYLLRRMVCGVPSNTLLGLFTYLYGRVFKVPSNKSLYYESINKFLCTVNSKDTVPSDLEFSRSLRTANIYGNLALCRYLLVDIENSDGKEVLDPTALTVEHIMPQTLGVAWRHIDAAEHEQYLHVLGNLSVTGYNSELSNKSFAEKKAIIAEHSKAVILNRDVKDKDIWTIADIQRRSRRLADILLRHYAIERIADERIEFEYVTHIDLLHANEVTGKKLVSFKFDGETYRQSKFILMLLDIIKLLDEKNPAVLPNLAANDFSVFPGAKRRSLSLDPEKQRRPLEIRDGVYMEANISASTVMRFIDRLLEEYGADKATFSISVVADEDDGSDEDPS